MKQKHRIASIDTGSIAQELEMEPGDVLLSINGKEIEDIFDYEYMVQDEYLEILIEKVSGEIWELEIEKDMEEPLGINFENSLMDDYKSCCNHCMFCFIDQMPKGMRDTLYFKDDDSRLSFLQGNYVTLTNMTEQDIDRIITYHLAPINISFHTLNPTLRCKMLNNRFAGNILERVQRLSDAGIEMNGQIVLCKGINDGEEMEYSLEMLTKWIPQLESVSVVPVGLTKFRDGLYPLESFTKEDACQVLDTIEKWQKRCMKRYQTHFVHPGDEWYLLAEREIPQADVYDGYVQLENGVGMVRLFLDEVEETLRQIEGDNRCHTISIASGKLAVPFLQLAAEQIHKKFPGIRILIYEIANHFFGERITVAGLLTGKDLTEQLTDKELGERLCLSVHMFRSGEEVFLDDLSKKDLEEALQKQITIVKSGGRDFVEAMIMEEIE